MEVSTKAHSRMEFRMALEDLSIQMEISIRETLNLEEPMDMEFMKIKLHFIEANSRTITSMARVLKKARHFISKGNFNSMKNMKERSHTITMFMKDFSLEECFMERVNLQLLMAFMSGISKKAIKMGLDNLDGKMAPVTEDNIDQELEMDKENISIQEIKAFQRDIGKMEF